MPYVAKPDTSDVILNVSDERGEISVNLYLREGDNGQGAVVLELGDEEARQLFEEGYLKSGSIGRLRDSDGKLLESAFEYANERGLGGLGDFQSKVGALVEEVAAALPEAYAKLDADKETYPDDDEDRRDDMVEQAVEDVAKAMASRLDVLSEARLEDVREYLSDHLGRYLDENEPASAPAP